MRVVEIESHAALARAIRFLAVLAIGKAFIAFQMAFTAGETACADTLRFLR